MVVEKHHLTQKWELYLVKMFPSMVLLWAQYYKLLQVTPSNNFIRLIGSRYTRIRMNIGGK